MKTRFVVSLAIVVTLLFSLPLDAQERLVISQVYSNSAAQYFRVERILKEAYSRIGMTVEYKILPQERSLVMANHGDTDGEFIRMAGLEQRYPNLVMVPVPITYQDIVVYTKEVEFTVDGWQSLSPYTIGIVRGFKMAEINTKGMNVELVTTSEQAFLKLNAGRSDIVVDLRNAQCKLKKLNLPEIKILEPPLYQMSLYHYLHKRHKSLAVKLEAVLRRMEQTGELKAMRDKYYQEVQDSCQ